MQTVWTYIKLLLQEQSDDLGLHCLSKRLLKISRQQNRTDDFCCDWGFYVENMSGLKFV